MRKLFYSLAAFALVATTACQESSMNSDLEAGTYADLTINANAITGVESRATLGDDSDAALTYYLEIYKEIDGAQELYLDLGSNATGQFSTRLITGQEYTFVAWANHNDDFYNTEDLRNVQLTDAAKRVINTTELDAFCGVLADKSIVENGAITFDITRPFARINVHTNDIASIPATSGLRPTAVELEYTASVYTAYNVLEGEVAGTPSLYSSQIANTIDTELGELSADYLFVSNEGGVAEFTATYYVGSDVVTTYNFSSIPYKKNYQTNISGNILTKQGDITVNVDKNWEGSTGCVVDAQTIAEANAAIAAAAEGEEVVVNVLGDISEDDTNVIVVPSDLKAENVTIVISNAKDGSTLYLCGDESKNESLYSNVISFENASEAAIHLNVATPNAHVELKGEFDNVIASTSTSTLEVAEATTIEQLDVVGGNVMNYGVVENIAKINNSSSVIYLVAGENTARKDSTLQEVYANNFAVESSSYDALVLSEGVHTGNIVLAAEKPLTVIGEGEATIFTGQFTNTNSDLAISNFTIKNTLNGVYTEGNAKLTAENVTFEVTPNTANNNTAVMQWNWKGVNRETVITNCRFFTAGARAVQLRGATSAVITGCTFDKVHSYAVQLDESNNNVVFSNNTVKNSTYGVYVHGATTASSIECENNTFENVYFDYTARPKALNDATNTGFEGFSYYVSASEDSKTNGWEAAKSKPGATVVLAGSFSKQLVIDFRNNGQTIISLNHAINPNENPELLKTSWKITAPIKFGYDYKNTVIENVTLKGLYLDHTFINQQYGGLKNVTIENCVFNGTKDNWNCGYIVHQASHCATENYTIKNNLFIYTEESDNTRLMIWGAKGASVNVIGNTMTGGYIHLDSKVECHYNVKDNNITAPEGALYSVVVANGNDESTYAIENNVLSGGYFCSLYLHSGNLVNGGNLTYANNTTSNSENIFGASGENIDEGTLTYSGFEDVAVYYEETRE